MADYSKYDNVLTGLRFGRLVAVSEVPKNERTNIHFREYICRCDCGKIVRVRKNNLDGNRARSCGCLQKDINERNMSKYHYDVIGKRFGRLVVESEVPKTEWKNKQKREFYCMCDCGKRTKVTRRSLVTGLTRSCGCLREYVSRHQYEDITGKTFGELTAIRKEKNHYQRSGNVITMWRFRCSCGREVVAQLSNVKSGSTKSCGHVGKSRAEYDINRWLLDHRIAYDQQATFSDLINPETGHVLRYDFKIYRNDGTFFIVEHHGVQHFKETDDGFGKLQREVTDKIKKVYCKLHNIKLYETFYSEDYIARLKEIVEYEIGQDGDAYEGEVMTG